MKPRKLTMNGKMMLPLLLMRKGKVYENNTEMQKILNSMTSFGFKDSYITKAGTSETTQFIFDIPLTVKKPYLKYRGDFLMGDMLDGNQFKNLRVKLF